MAGEENKRKMRTQYFIKIIQNGSSGTRRVRAICKYEFPWSTIFLNYFEMGIGSNFMKRGTESVSRITSVKPVDVL